ncbi:MAG: hypothetical protein ABR915_05695 [Thermoguttaceae bacterium]
MNNRMTIPSNRRSFLRTCLAGSSGAVLLAAAGGARGYAANETIVKSSGAGETWKLTNPTDVRYVDEPVRLGLAAPAGVEGRNLVVRADGKEVVWQVEEIEGRKFLWVSYHSVTLPGGAGQECPGYFAGALGNLRSMARQFKDCVIAVVFVAVCTSSALAAPAVPDAANAIHEIVLEKALPGERAMHVYLRAENGKFTDALAACPARSNTNHVADASQLVLEGNRIRGQLKAALVFDGYWPADGKPRACAYRIDATLNGAMITGAFEGTCGAGRENAPAEQSSGAISGRLAPRPDLAGYWVVDLQMENGSGTGALGPKSWGNRVYPRLFFKDGKLVQSLIYGWGRRAQINYFESAITENNLVFDGKRLAGSITVRPTQEQKAGQEATYVFAFDGRVVGPQIGGVFTKCIGGKEAPGGPFRGTLEPMAAQPEDRAVYYIELHGAVAAAHQLHVFLPRLDGRFQPGIAYSGGWNHTYHDVDPAELRLVGDRLEGRLRATVNADPYVPKDKQPSPCLFEIHAKLLDGRILQGSYTGTFRDQKVSGPVFGELAAVPPVPEPVHIHLKLDDAVNGGAPWFRRLYCDFIASEGRADKGGWSNNKGGWQGAFRRAEVKFEGSRFTATLEGTVDKANGPKTGAYLFRLSGRVVGSEIVGTCDTYHEGQRTKTGTAFMGGFK